MKGKREMRLTTVPFWAVTGEDLSKILGFDKDGDEDDKPKPDEDDDEGENDDEDDEGKKPKEDDDETDPESLKRALKRERRKAKRAERQLAARRKLDEQKDQGKKDEAEQAKKDKEDADARSARLAERLRENAIDTQIIKLAKGAKGMPQFKDVDDALRLVSREDIDVEQDDDAPENVKVDAESVMDALKELAKKKPHLIRSTEKEDEEEEDDTEDLPTSGSKFGGKKKNKREVNDDKLKSDYPALMH